jgi:hypothetical protein
MRLPALALTAALIGGGVAATPAAQAAQVVVGIGLPYPAPPVAVVRAPLWAPYGRPYFRPVYGWYGYRYGYYGRYAGPWRGGYYGWRR